MSGKPYPTFDGFSLQDDNFISSNVIYRNSPSRNLDSQKITRRPGSKLIATDFGEKTINISGNIVADSSSELQTLIDSFNANVTRKESGIMYVDSDRSAVATVKSVGIGDSHYNQSYVPFEIEFLLNDPFFYGLQQTVSYTIVSGTASMTDTITISGSVFAEPSITFASNAGTGYTTTSGISIIYNNTNETVTWSGTSGHSSLSYGNLIQFDFSNHRIIEEITETEIEGVFARWEPGQQTYQVTFSGTSQGGTLNFAYQPRYL
jgi:predicted phage tail component-like protein